MKSAVGENGLALTIHADRDMSAVLFHSDDFSAMFFILRRK